MCWSCSRNRGIKRSGICIYEDSAGKIYLCKKCLDSWLDNADDDEVLEPLSLEFIDGPYFGKVLI